MVRVGEIFPAYVRSSLRLKKKKHGMTTVEFSQAGKGESMLGICWPLSGDWVALRE